MSKLLDLNDVTKVFRVGGAIRGRKLTAVDGVSLSLDEKPGIHAVVGESGCGKTTLCKMILRIHGIDGGDISLVGRSFATSDILKSNLFTKHTFSRPWMAAILFLIIGVFSVLLINYVTLHTQYSDVLYEVRRIERLDHEIFELERQRDELIRQSEEPGASLRLPQQIAEMGWLIGDLNRLLRDFLENEGVDKLAAISVSADSLQWDTARSIITFSIMMGAALVTSAFLYLLSVKKVFAKLCDLGMPRYVAVLKSLVPVSMICLLAMIVGNIISLNYIYDQAAIMLRQIHNPEGLLPTAYDEIRWLYRVIDNADEAATFTFLKRSLFSVGAMFLLLGFTAIGSIIMAKKPEKRTDVYDFKSFRKDVQPIFQNPYETFSMRKRVDSYLFSTAKRVRGVRKHKEMEEVVDEVLHSVGMSLAAIKGKYASQFSGGELQRISIARALIPRPKFIVADEPVAAIDASMKMNVVNLFKELKEKYNVSFIYITHDLSTAYYVSDYIATLYRGSLIEHGPAEEVMDNPAHPYTQLLMNSVPRVGDKWDESAVMPDMEEKEYAIAYCKFAPRCSYATDECRKEKPKSVKIGDSRTVLCNYPLTT